MIHTNKIAKVPPKRLIATKGIIQQIELLNIETTTLRLNIYLNGATSRIHNHTKDFMSFIIYGNYQHKIYSC